MQKNCAIKYENQNRPNCSPCNQLFICVEIIDNYAQRINLGIDLRFKNGLRRFMHISLILHIVIIKNTFHLFRYQWYQSEF